MVFPKQALSRISPSLQWLTVVLLFAPLPTAGVRAQATQQPPTYRVVAKNPDRNSPLSIDTVLLVGGGDGPPTFTAISALTVDSAGRFWVADAVERHILVLDQAGRLVTTLGRRGDGPGEYQAPSIMTTSIDGFVLVLDPVLARVTIYAPSLEIADILQLPRRLNARGLLATQEELVISGSAGQLDTNAIHVFSRRDGGYRRGFGALPAVSDPALRQFVGAGPIAWSRDGGIWYAHPAPYLLEKFDLSGRVRLRIERTTSVLGPPGAGVTRRQARGGMTVTTRMQWRMAGISEGPNGMLFCWIVGLRESIIDLFSGVSGPGPVRLDATWTGNASPLANWYGGDRVFTELAGDSLAPLVAVLRVVRR